MTIQDIQSLAEAHGLLLTDKMNFNEMGIMKIVYEGGPDAAFERGLALIIGGLEQVRLSPASSPAGRTNLVLALAAGS
ncbi:hypothetical protein DN464_04305 [Enterobacter cloacae]|nr:hypothetical protein DN464_04305 [Enterobacter cloacae]